MGIKTSRRRNDSIGTKTIRKQLNTLNRNSGVRHISHKQIAFSCEDEELTLSSFSMSLRGLKCCSNRRHETVILVEELHF